ncbi:MAG: hypothetical protein EXQ67_06600 [Thermoleophilia bacterium]|nr:hypothetical protein [Thermoleophilia bacterium]
MDLHDETAAHPPELTLFEYVVGELGSDRSDGIRVHVEGCPECRDRIVSLAMEIDELDRLPLVAIPHDLIRGAFDGRSTQRRRSLLRILPIVVLLAAATGVVGLFEIGGLENSSTTVEQRQVVVATADSDPVGVVDALLAGITHTTTVDQADARHLIVLVSDDDVDVAVARLEDTASPNGKSYVVDVGGAGQLLDTSAP